MKSHYGKRIAVLVLLLLSLGLSAYLAEQTTGMPEKKRTALQLYCSPTEAIAMWKDDPQGVGILDVRTPEEYGFIGHPPMARNIPYALMEYKLNEKKNFMKMSPNPLFLDRVKQHYTPETTLILLCAGGVRSAKAADALAKAGYERVYSVPCGFQGDKKNKTELPKNGWMREGAPWTYAIDPNLVYLEAPADGE